MDNDTICKNCGKRYGEHSLALCYCPNPRDDENYLDTTFQPVEEKPWGAFKNFDSTRIVYAYLIEEDKDPETMRKYKSEDGYWYHSFQPCAKPVPWPPEPVAKKLILEVTDQLQFQAWLESHNKGVLPPGMSVREEQEW